MCDDSPSLSRARTLGGLVIASTLLTACAQSQTSEPMPRSNALLHETSPYLKQHAYNPVEWMPWGEAAWEDARTQNRLVIVSVGYSACHWCHVMEHETFEDSTAAALMNAHFVSIKVDREERPDVDGVYMSAVQLMTGRGGWPMNVICLPDGRPIYGGTYFPREKWMTVLQQIQTTWEEEPEKALQYAEKLATGVAGKEIVDVPDEVPGDWAKSRRSDLDNKVDDWEKHWDREWGGTARAPKFPLPGNLDFLLRYGLVQNDHGVLAHVEQTLLAMERGGIHDHVGGGFARYSVDGKWHVPHFEKMLYDNAQLIRTYSLACEALPRLGENDRAAMRRAAVRTVEWASRELRDSRSGAFYSALDADSEDDQGHLLEGAFYTWTVADLRAALTQEELDLLRATYDLDGKSAWSEHQAEANVLMRWSGTSATPELFESLDKVHEKLRVEREKREPPRRDDKILTAWNGLMISGLVSSARAFDRPVDLEMAEKVADFLIDTMGRSGTLKRVYHRDSGPRIGAMADDYAFAIGGLLDLYAATFEPRYFTTAVRWMTEALNELGDPDSGAIWFSASASEDHAAFSRRQDNDDSVIPSANSQMARDLRLLGHMTGNARWLDRSARLLAGSWERIDYLQSGTNWAQLILESSLPSCELVITGPNKDHVKNAAREIAARCPEGVHLLSAWEDLEPISPLLVDRQLGTLSYFVCTHGQCQLPVHDIDAALEQLLTLQSTAK